jgi:malate dehydrogenase
MDIPAVNETSANAKTRSESFGDKAKLTVVITGAAGRIAYSLIPLVLNGSVFGPRTRISLRLLDVEFAETILHGVELEVKDSCYALLDDLIATTSPEQAFAGADIAVLLGGFPRAPGMERRDLIEKNAAGMRDQATALDSYASKDCKVLVVANPANTNCLVCIKTCKTIPAENFTCLTRLDQERLRGLSCEKVNSYLEGTGWKTRISPSDVREVAIFGNHSSTQVTFPDSVVLSLSMVFAAGSLHRRWYFYC